MLELVQCIYWNNAPLLPLALPLIETKNEFERVNICCCGEYLCETVMVEGIVWTVF